jgi:hypothetical protein
VCTIDLEISGYIYFFLLVTKAISTDISLDIWLCQQKECQQLAKQVYMNELMKWTSEFKLLQVSILLTVFIEHSYKWKEMFQNPELHKWHHKLYKLQLVRNLVLDFPKLA